MNLEYEKYIREDGKVAVVYMPYGDGWSTLKEDVCIQAKMVFDRRIVEKVLADKQNDITEEFITDIFEIDDEDDYFYVPPVYAPYRLDIAWIDPETKFVVTYSRGYYEEGYEEIHKLEDINWLTT